MASYVMEVIKVCITTQYKAPGLLLIHGPLTQVTMNTENIQLTDCW